ncbi:MAG: enoyl-CoA hydratase/isomerase family protein [Alphaproteobacteria bacterium]|nr:enoyl-CoA hydratase/isomerase family protein [Alphaproteobacteria bacterium]
MTLHHASASSRIRVTRDRAVLRIVLTRPDKLNALDSDLVEDLISALDDARRHSVRLVAISGEGKDFSGGFDFSGLDGQSDGDLALRFLRLEHLLQAVHYAPFVTIALVHGACFGAAADLVASCTFRFAAPASRFRMPGLQFAVALGTRRLAEVVGRQAALKILLGSTVFGTQEAIELGFLTGISERREWDAKLAELTETGTSLPQTSFERLLRLTRPDHRDADMAELARSIAEPGLKQRIEAYLASIN